MSQVRLRSALENTPAYVPGKPAAPTPGVQTYKLSSNESHLPPLPQVAQAMVDAAVLPANYPDPGVTALTEQTAAHFGVSTDSVIFGAGASEILTAVFRLAADEDHNVVFPWPSFESYAQLAALSGTQARPVPLTADYRQDVDALAAAVDEDTRLLVLCSPNNPTGPTLHQDELDRLLAAVPDDLLVVLDEAYIEFANDPQTADGPTTLPAHKNLVVLRTFSKAHGLAGLRIGYALAAPEIIHELHKAIPPFSVSAVAQAAASASLAAQGEVEVRAKEVAALRDGLVDRLRQQGWPVPSAQGNFVWLPVHEDSDRIEAAFKAAGLAVRNLHDGVRISVGPEAAMDRVVEVASGLESKYRTAPGAPAATDGGIA